MRSLSHGRSRRAGMSIVYVMCMISLTLGVSYAVIRAEMSAVRVQSNSSRRATARQAAMQGLSVAMRKMQEAGWTIDATPSGNLGPLDSYQARYLVGDDALAPHSAEYAEFPYRVTIISTGTSIDPANVSSRAVHRVRAVMRLVPKQLATRPSDLGNIAEYTVFQIRDDHFDVECPLHIAGKTRIQGRLNMSGYSWSSAIRDRYLDDIRRMRLAGLGDYRVFTGPIELFYQKHSQSTRSWITGVLGASISNAPSQGVSSQWVHPGAVGSYRLYPGGPSYTVPTVGSSIQNTTLKADPVTNPLGLFLRTGNMTVGSNTTIHGTLIATDDLTLDGSNIQIQPAVLRPLAGASDRFILPSLFVADDMRVTGSAEPTIEGMVAVWDEFKLDQRSQTKDFAVRGTFAAQRYEMDAGVTQFDNSSLWWNLASLLFGTQLNGPPHNRIEYFPVWLEATSGLQFAPSTQFLPATTPTTYAWITSGGAVYAPGPSDGGGLRWELVDWDDSP